MTSHEQDDLELNSTTSKRFVGFARVDISVFHFMDGREIDDRITKGLIKLFQRTRCRRYDPDNYLKVLITKSQLKRALRSSKIPQNSLKTPTTDGSFHFLHVGPNEKLICRDGQHRIKAAEYFEAGDRWWTVELFLSHSEGILLQAREGLDGDMILEAHQKTHLGKDRYHHQSGLCDGEIYRKIRQCQKKKMWSEVDVLKQRLSESKQVALKQLLKRDDFTEAFDDLLPFPGLWVGLELGNIQRHLAMHCDEVSPSLAWATVCSIFVGRTEISTPHTNHMEPDYDLQDQNTTKS